MEAARVRFLRRRTGARSFVEYRGSPKRAVASAGVDFKLSHKRRQHLCKSMPLSQYVALWWI